MVKAILWDVDGTLLDFLAAEKTAVRRLFREFGLGECTDEMVARYSAINDSYWKRLERGEITKQQVLIGRYREFFAEVGVDPSLAEPFNARYQHALGDTVVYRDDSLNVVKALLAHGADPNAYVGEKGDSLLMYACLYCPDAIKLALIEGGANVKAKDASGRTALLYELAREKNASVDVIKAMLAKGATAADAGKLNGLGAKEFATQFCTAEVAALL